MQRLHARERGGHDQCPRRLWLQARLHRRDRGGDRRDPPRLRPAGRLHRGREVDNLDRYDAVVLGSAVYMRRWRREARRFLHHHARELAERPLWVFSSGPVGDPAKDNPAWLEPGRTIAEAERLGARDHVVFGGVAQGDRPRSPPSSATGATGTRSGPGRAASPPSSRCRPRDDAQRRLAPRAPDAAEARDVRAARRVASRARARTAGVASPRPTSPRGSCRSSDREPAGR